ncbi:CLUMA_CG018479, isoform A [Clunio marinus]|uniref:CLUMA_CG018479, isoform A n=1 Tax=Clunio marinus TaxID=568069 RepID=A0A1J1J044_9DIPT|nr:CLUMA_CG018479, isoform A [Clunio marinus]
MELRDAQIFSIIQNNFLEPKVYNEDSISNFGDSNIFINFEMSSEPRVAMTNTDAKSDYSIRDESGTSSMENNENLLEIKDSGSNSKGEDSIEVKDDISDPSTVSKVSIEKAHKENSDTAEHVLKSPEVMVNADKKQLNNQPEANDALNSNVDKIVESEEDYDEDLSTTNLPIEDQLQPSVAELEENVTEPFNNNTKNLLNEVKSDIENNEIKKSEQLKENLQENQNELKISLENSKIETSSTTMNASDVNISKAITDNQVKEILTKNVELVEKEGEEEEEEKFVVRFDSKGDSIHEDDFVATPPQSCKENVKKKKISVSQEENIQNISKENVKESPDGNKVVEDNGNNSDENPKFVVRFDSKGNSIEENETNNGEANKEEANKKKSSHKDKTSKDENKALEDEGEEQVDPLNKPTNEIFTSSSLHWSQEDDGIPVITIPLGEILQKYARMLQSNSRYEYYEAGEEESPKIAIKEIKDKGLEEFSISQEL